jgi:hypothetical protein
MRLLNPTPAARRLLEIVRAEQMFEIVHTVGLEPIAHSQRQTDSLPTTFCSATEFVVEASQTPVEWPLGVTSRYSG